MSETQDDLGPLEGELEEIDRDAADQASPAETRRPYISAPIEVPEDTSPGNLLAIAVARGASVDELDRLLALKERFEAGEARKAFTAAMAQFKADAPVLFKDKRVEFDTSSGQTSYMHATLGAVCLVIAESLGKYGLSHRWEIVGQQPDWITVRCTITHELGHSESTELSAGPDGSGGKNPI